MATDVSRRIAHDLATRRGRQLLVCVCVGARYRAAAPSWGGRVTAPAIEEARLKAKVDTHNNSTNENV